MQQPLPLTSPPLPERVRTLAATAAASHVAEAGSNGPAAAARGGVDAAGRPVLLVKPGEPLHGLRPGEDAAVTVDLTATRRLGEAEQPRALLKVQGWAQPVPYDELRAAAVTVAEHYADEDLFTVLERAPRPSRGPGPAADVPRLLRVDVAQVVFLTGQESGVLDADEYLEAAPDPLLPAAERMLEHVNTAHRDQVRMAARRLLDTPPHEVCPDAWLWELDRFGVTLRTGLTDATLVRLPWPTPAVTAAALEHALRCLLCHHTA
jgi:hypothetical protein